ncbi:hypothetical protein PsYK624_054190 [Phanerochaete sordida]|uniref:Uncharacterized protein n=1 Tax=Phanerochaete sordida TaxID=48140 RepID=A0A9P3LBL2_9APHY|nr:hypothetical protein PsYK624_054190 [Phanerochaete sordida]
MRSVWPASPVYLFVTTALIFLHVPPTIGTLINVVVDDQDPSILYASAEWNMGQSCITCDADIDPKQVLGGTWHDVTFRDNGQDTQQSMTFNFTGSAIYVYGMQVQLFTRASANVQFSIDGELADTYAFRTESLNDTYKYNQLLFSKTDFGEAHHTLMLVNGRSGEGDSLVLLDYLMYTTDTSSFDTTAVNSSPAASVPTETVTATASSGASCNVASGLNGVARAAVVCLAAVLGVVLVAGVVMAWKIRQQQRSIIMLSARPAVESVQAQGPPPSNPFFTHPAAYNAMHVSTQGAATGSIGSGGSRMMQGMRSDNSSNVAAAGSSIASNARFPGYKTMY